MKKKALILAPVTAAASETMKPYQLISIGLLIGGVVLIIFGISAADSFSSDVSRFFTGTPTDRSMWMLVGGIVLVCVGAFGALSFGGDRRYQ